ncbi:tRNA-splicing endonuclease subunit Sen2 [Ochlerotatus camptorhynchus]|uniref:tRNA-splicing endonuclease subunit Sen2 n=1 Tax=Ochlerotatus camptorhynchus TaxID=644619 RepID=UPI0031D523EE
MKRHLRRPIAKAKKFTPPNLADIDPLPVDSRETAPNKRFVAIFTGLTVEVCDSVGIQKLALGGCFGQGTLSRSFPASVRDRGAQRSNELVVRRRQLDRREEWRRKYGQVGGSNCVNVRVMEEDVEKQLADGAIGQRQLKYALVGKEVDPFPIPENLSLFFEESMFLVRELKCLEVRTLEGATMPEILLLETFSKLKRNFLVSYVAYVYLKSKNWVIKSGLKFGGDFLLYQKGPQFFHASYVVLIQPYQNCAQQPGGNHYMDNYDFQCFNRIAETTAKDLLVLEVYYPTDIDPSDCVAGVNRLNEFRVSEVFPKHHNYAAYRNSHQQSTSSSK